jgi:hypothetical protein
MMKSYWYLGASIGFLIGFVFDVIFAISTYGTCTASLFQKLFGIEPLFCFKTYILGIWLTIIGGGIGHLFKR